MSAVTPGSPLLSSSTCSATVCGTFWATGIGWYGEPCQQGCETPAVHSRTRSRRVARLILRMPASRVSSAVPPSDCWDKVAMFTATTSSDWFPTMTCPVSSRIWPRTDGWTMSLTRSWLASAT